MKLLPPGLFVNFFVPLATTEQQLCDVLKANGFQVTPAHVSLNDIIPDRPVRTAMVSFPNEVLEAIVNKVLGYQNATVSGGPLRCRSLHGKNRRKPPKPLTPEAA